MGTFTITQSRADADLYLIPSANGCNIELIPIGAATNWECVDDPINIPDEDSTYNYIANPDIKQDLYIISNDVTGIGTINYIQIFARTKSYATPQDESGIYKLIITDNACTNIYKSSDKGLLTSYKTYTNTWTENPRTTSAWTLTDINNLQIGIECNSPEVTGEYISTFRPDGNGDIIEWGAHYDTNWMNVLLAVHGYNRAGGQATYRTDLYTMDNHDINLHRGTISKIRVYFELRTAGIANTAARIKTGGSMYVGTLRASGTWTLWYEEWVNNPQTSNAWTWNEIDNLQIGIYGNWGADVRYVFCNIYHDKTIPQIRTTQCYVRVNHAPTDATCILNKPEDISVDHSMNIKTLNFWSGNREVYSLSRNNKNIILTGSEYQSDTCNKACPCERITCIREMGKNGSAIVVLGLRNLFNGNYKIRSFGWKHISKKPEHYEWILELEYDD